MAEVGTDSDTDQIFRLTYDGSVADERGFVAMGGASDAAEERLGTGWRPGMTLSEVLRLAVDVLGAGENGERRPLDEAQLEVAVLDRDRPRRSFRRIVGPLLTRLLGEPRETTDAPAGLLGSGSAPAPGDPTTTGESPEGSAPATPPA